MRTMCLLCLTVTWAAWMPGRNYAATSSPASRPTSAGSSTNTASGHPGDAGHAASPRDGRRTVVANHPSRRVSVTLVNRPKAPPNSRQRFMPGNALPPSVSNKSAGRGEVGLIPIATVHNAIPARTPGIVRPAVPPASNVRHRGPNPAVVDGSPGFHGSNAGALNGTGMKRKY